MKQWLVRAGLVALGTFMGSLVVEDLARVTLWRFVPRLDDAEAASFATAISLLGSILGGVSVMTFLLAKTQRLMAASCLTWFCGVPVLALCLLFLILALSPYNNRHALTGITNRERERPALLGVSDMVLP